MYEYFFQIAALCGSLGSPSNGQVTVTGSAATYTCNDGFTLSGVGMVTCQLQSGGQWSDLPPTCEPICMCPHNYVIFHYNMYIITLMFVSTYGEN